MKKLKRIIYAIFFCLSLTLSPVSCLATHFYTATLDELVKSSNFVFVGEVKNVGRTLMGYRKASLAVREKIKGKDMAEMTVKYGESWFQSQANVPVLNKGKQYLFFIVDIEGELHLAGITGSKYYSVEDSGEVMCGDEKINVNACIEKGREIVAGETKQPVPRPFPL